ncbi:hypothetical protein D3C73_1317290 [compost metagenome]
MEESKGRSEESGISTGYIIRRYILSRTDSRTGGHQSKLGQVAPACFSLFSLSRSAAGSLAALPYNHRKIRSLSYQLLN